MLDLAETPPSCESYVNSLQQIRDLVPILDAIDTSGKTLHGIVDNILSFLDLKAGNTLDAPSGGPKALVDMLEEVLLEAHEDNARSKRASCVETVLDVDPHIGSYAEDKDGALRR
jgi:signal transduction histidine kinase